MRLLFVSTHTDQTTGYAKVSYNILRHLQNDKSLEIFHFGFQRHATFRRPKLDINQYDAQANEDPKEQGFGFNVFKQYLDLVNPSAIFIYNDTLIGNRFLSLIPEDHPAKIYFYLDQVYNNTDLGNIAKRATGILVFSQSWKRHPTDHVLPHAPDVTTVMPLPASQIEDFKTKLNLQNKTIFLNINRNSERKRLDLTIQAFKLYHEKHPTSHLIIVTNKEGYYNIPAIVQIEQLPTDAITFVHTPISDEQINLFYNIADYGINTANGEGYGLSTLEHAYLHKPQIVLKLGAFPDFLDEASNILIPPTLRIHTQPNPFGFYNLTTTPLHIATEMEKLPTKTPPTITQTWEQVTSTLRSILNGTHETSQVLSSLQTLPSPDSNKAT